jgi:hypothetical protein
MNNPTIELEYIWHDECPSWLSCGRIGSLWSGSAQHPPCSQSTTAMPMVFPVLYLYPINADSLVKRNHTVNIARLTNTTPILAESSIVTSTLKSACGYAIMQRSVASLYFVGDYVPHPSVLDTYQSSNSTFINVSPESESHTGQNQTTTWYVTTLPSFYFFCFVFWLLFLVRIRHRY